MRKTIYIILIFIHYSLFCQVSEKVLFENFKKTMSIGNEAFIIINVTDSNSNLTKEYCSTNHELQKALEIEFNSSSRKAYKAIRKSKSINFNFKNKEALELFEHSYNADEIVDFEKKSRNR